MSRINVLEWDGMETTDRQQIGRPCALSKAGDWTQVNHEMVYPYEFAA